MPQRKYVTPQCCKVYEKFAPVFLNVDYLELREGRHPFPKWKVKASDAADEYGHEDWIDASFCPCCGTQLPGIKWRETVTEKICKVTDGGYYCDTCDDRLSNCRCLPPEFAFEIARGD